MPTTGQDFEQHLVQKYGPNDRNMLQEPNSRLKQMGSAVGIEFNNQRRMLLTVPVHQLIVYAKTKYGNEKANALMELIVRTVYFVQPHDISQTRILEQAAQELDMDVTVVQTSAGGTSRQSDSSKKIATAKQHLGVTGVPYFIVQGSNEASPTTFSGAYSVSVIAGLSQKAAVVWLETP